MSEYSIRFAKQLTYAAKNAIKQDKNLVDIDAKRIVLYFSNVACEISLKAFLEHAGVHIKDIKKRKHDLSGLLEDVGKLKIIHTLNDRRHEIPATSLRGVVVDKRYGNATVGNALTAEKKGSMSFCVERDS